MECLWSQIKPGMVVFLKNRAWWVTDRLEDGSVICTDPINGLVQPAGHPDVNTFVTVLEPDDPGYIAPPVSVVFDLETGDSSALFRSGPDFIKICGYNDVITDNPDELIKVLDAADEIVGHNILGFDVLALVRTKGVDWETYAAKSRDTLILARLANPPRARDTGGSVDKYDLDHVASHYGVAGKSGSLAALKKEFGGFDAIPNDDPRYVDYLRADVVASRAVAGKLPMTRYGKREHRLASLAGRMTLNGFKVDLPLLGQRITEGEIRKTGALATLADTYGLPLSRTVMRGRGKAKAPVVEPHTSPLSASEAQPWLADIYKTYGLKRAPRTPKGKLSISAKDLEVISSNLKCPEELKKILELMKTVTTIRTVYQTTAENLAGNRVHPSVSMGQASGRWSFTKPGMTVFGKRGGRHHERDIFLPEEGHVLLSCDLSQVDMRGIAGHCQDPNYMALFAPGKDVHTEIALQIWGDPHRRQDAKAIGHGANYGLGANKLIAAGHNPEVVRAFFAGMASNFPVMIKWRNEIRDRAGNGELLDNGFGRMMRCEPERAYTQAPALMGQGSARDLMCDALLRLPDYFRPFMRVMVHDELVVSVPADRTDELGEELRKAFTSSWRGVPILCDLSKPGVNWGEISAK